MTKLTKIDYWKKAQGEPNIELDENNIIKKWIEKNIDIKSIKNCLEIGCYPGRYLTIFGNKGVEISGIDYLPGVLHLGSLFKRKGYKIGKFYYLDFYENSIIDKYECVYSLGFIEHFEDWESVLVKHIDLVEDGGLLIIEVPNFSGWMQKLPRLIFDRENYYRHNIKAMDMQRWIQILEKNEFEILNSDYIGGYMMWFERECNWPESLLRRLFLRLLRLLKISIYPNTENHQSFSGAIGVIAKKNS